MENSVKDLKPEKVFRFFSEICSIPHGSGNLDGIVDYLVNFAKERKLYYKVDNVKNVIIKTEASSGEPVILQAHTDMVCVKTPDSKIDMSKDPLDIYVDGKYLKAHGTSLGADDGIGVAIILALLDDIVEGKGAANAQSIEAFFTSDEETGMNGAIGINGTIFAGKKLINIDSEDEGVLTVSCAGGSQCRTEFKIDRLSYSDIEKNGSHYESYSIKVSGLLGGHSGMEIHKGRANAICEDAYILKTIMDEGVNFYLASIRGGKFENVICQEATSVVYINSRDIDKTISLIAKLNDELKDEYKLTDPAAHIIFEKYDSNNIDLPIKKEFSDKIIDTLCTMPQGLIEISQEFINLPWTSLNTGAIDTKNDRIEFSTLIRSNNDVKRTKLVKKFKNIVEKAGAQFKLIGEYPAWKYNKESKLIEEILKTYKDIYGKEMEVVATHGGLECGLLLERIKDADAISIGPTVHSVHSVDEELEIETVEKVYNLLKEFLKIK